LRRKEGPARTWRSNPPSMRTPLVSGSTRRLARCAQHRRTSTVCSLADALPTGRQERRSWRSSSLRQFCHLWMNRDARTTLNKQVLMLSPKEHLSPFSFPAA
jgi:hypothetical protein